MRWFGASWGAPVCEPETQASTPIGRPCSIMAGGCGTLICQRDQGVLLPDASTGQELVLHLDCFLPLIGLGPCRTHGVVDCRTEGTSREGPQR